ncbi:type I-B CRISPR-associated protein Cas5b [Brotaphodocola sp.]|uniref:type I-B CRISPR-associated protein Cas5b n=1 Tax=Brotaphodocola sp. TaxID=3073577 RepID=UPI003D7E9DC6
MEILRFSLSGSTACFHKPEVNTYFYFTYGNIHKIALLGMFGAILGYDGHNQMKGYGKERRQGKLSEGFPDFYEKLKDLHISVLPVYPHGLIPKKIQNFNNSVGYASKEQGGNWIIKEQWLENPSWEIAVLIDSPEAEKLKSAICENRCVYYPYLGKNDHMADIKNVRLEEANDVEFSQGQLNCFVPIESVKVLDLDLDDIEELLEEQWENLEKNNPELLEDLDEKVWIKKKKEDIGSFKYREALPYSLDSWTNLYQLKTFLYTNYYLEMTDKQPVYQLSDGKNIVFY